MAFSFEPMKAKLKTEPRTIVFTEGTDPRILEAAARLLSATFLMPVLVGNREEILSAAEEVGFNVKGAEILDPETFEDMDKMVAEMVALRKGKMTEEERAAIVTRFKCSLFDDFEIALEDIFSGMLPEPR